MTDLIAEYEASLLRRRCTKATIDGYTGILRRMDRQIKAGVACATLDEIEAWIYAGDRSDTTLGHYCTVARQFGRWAVAAGRLDYHWSEDLPQIAPDSEERRPATEAEFALVLEKAADPWRDLYELAGWAGLRGIEISRIRREEITEYDIRIFGKGNKWRRVPTHPRLWERFAGRPAGGLARGPEGNPLTPIQVIQRGNYYLRRICPGVSMHMLRKRFAMAVYEDSGHDIRLVQHLLGHKFVSTTQKYIGVDTDRAGEVVRGLRPPEAR